MRIRRLIFSGIVGGIVAVAIIVVTERLAGSTIDICTIAGVLVTGRTDPAGWLVGFVVQLVIAVIAAFVYAALFEWVTRRPGSLVGLAIAIPHTIVAGLSVGFLPGDSLLARDVPPSGAFLEYEGWWAVLAFVGAHLVFGVLIGLMYGKTRHAIPSTRRLWLDVSRSAR
jgi:uncharacterized membrane protein